MVYHSLKIAMAFRLKQYTLTETEKSNFLYGFYTFRYQNGHVMPNHLMFWKEMVEKKHRQKQK